MKKYIEKLNKEIEKAQKLAKEAASNYMTKLTQDAHSYFACRTEYLNGLKKAKELLEEKEDK